MELIVIRSQWYRGRGIEGSELLRHDGTMCCVGFYGKACGLPDSQLLSKATISSVARKYKYSADSLREMHGLDWLYEQDVETPWFCNTEAANDLYEINDNKDISDSQREEELTKVFAEHGVNVTFVD